MTLNASLGAGGWTATIPPVSTPGNSGIAAFIGDSWFAQWLAGNRTTQFYRAADCSIAHACQLTNYAFTPVGAGVGGNTSAMMLARLQTDVLAYRPAQVVIGATINDPDNSVTVAEAISNYTTMIQRCLDSGAKVRIHNIPPVQASYFNATKWGLLHAVNRWINFVLPTLFPGVSVYDRFSACVDSAANPVEIVSGTYKDSRHYASALAAKIGRADADWLLKFYAPGNFAAKSAGDNVVALTGSRVINQYALMAGSGGTNGTGATGTVATGNTVKRNAGTGAAVTSVVAHDVVGNWQQVAITGASNTDIWTCGPTSTVSAATAGLVAGGSYYWEGEVDVSNISGLNEVYLVGVITFDSTTYSLRDNSPNTGNQAGSTTPYRKMLRTEVFTIPASAVSLTSLDVQIFCTFASGVTNTGTVTLKAGRLTPVALQ